LCEGARTRGKSLFSVLGRGQIGCRFSGRAIGSLIQIVEAIDAQPKRLSEQPRRCLILETPLFIRKHLCL
jgi:hypothetical protein